MVAYGCCRLESSANVSRRTALSRAATADLSAYLADLNKRGLAARSAARRLSALRQFFKFLVAENIRTDDPSAAVDGPKLGRPLPKLLDEDEMVRLIEVCAALDGASGARLKALVELSYASGLRVSELVGMPPSTYRERAADGTGEIPTCLAKQVLRPIRNREATGGGRN